MLQLKLLARCLQFLLPSAERLTPMSALTCQRCLYIGSMDVLFVPSALLVVDLYRSLDCPVLILSWFCCLSLVRVDLLVLSCFPRFPRFA